MGEHTFSLEELCTVLCRIEAILNSRPLVQLSSDPAEYDYLTPGHFLIGRLLLSIPEVPIEDSAPFSSTVETHKSMCAIILVPLA